MPYIKLTKENNARRVFVTEAQLFAAASRKALWQRVMVELAYAFGSRRSDCSA